MNALKKLIYLLLVLVVAVQIYLFTQDKTAEVSGDTKSVSVSSFALYDIAKHISGGSIEIINILPFGVDPHSFEPTPKLMAAIEKSDVMFYSGAGLEPWIEGVAFKNRAVDMSKHVKLLEFEEAEEHEHDEHQHHEHEHDEEHEEHEVCDHSGIDPHYWLDFENMQKMLAVIKDEFIRLEPKNKTLYEANAAKYSEMLKMLTKEYSDELQECKMDVVILNHNAIGYLAHKYEFRVESLSGFSPDAEPNPKDLMRIFEEIKKEGVTTLFFESFVSNKTMKSVAKDANVNLEVLQPLGNITAKEAEQNLSYEQVMRTNLDKLSKALECK